MVPVEKTDNTIRVLPRSVELRGWRPDMLNYRLILPFVCAALLMQAPAASAQTIDPSYRSDVEKLLEVTGSVQMANQLMTLFTRQLVEGVKRSQPSMPDRELEIVKEVLDSELAKIYAGPESIIEEYITIYMKHFTHDEVRGLLAFYSTDLGKKLVVSTPLMVQEGATLAQKWVEKQTPRFTSLLEARLRAEGFIK